MIKEMTATEFMSVRNDEMILVDFFSSTCGPCKMLSYVLADLDKELDGKITIVKLDFDKNTDLVEEFNVTGYPTLIVLKNGKESARMSGLKQKPEILRLIKELQA